MSLSSFAKCHSTFYLLYSSSSSQVVQFMRVFASMQQVVLLLSPAPVVDSFLLPYLQSYCVAIAKTLLPLDLLELHCSLQ